MVIILLLTIERFYYLSQGWLDRETSLIVQGLQWGQWWVVPSRAPYGLLWYLANFWYAFDTTSWTLGTILIDAIAMFFVARKSVRIFAFYAFFSWLMFTFAVYDVSILWFIVLSLYYPRTLPLAIIAKFPVFAWNDAVWAWIVHPLGLASNWIYYSMLGIVWITVLGHHLKMRPKRL